MYKCSSHVKAAKVDYSGLLSGMGSRRLLGGTLVQLLVLGTFGALLLALQVGVGLEGRLGGGAVGGLLLVCT